MSQVLQPSSANKSSKTTDSNSFEREQWTEMVETPELK